MKTYNNIRVLIVIAITVMWGSFSLSAYGNDDFPEPGSSCSDEYAGKVLETSSRTKWLIDEVFVVPIGIVNPDNWESATEYRLTVNAAREGNRSLDFAETVVAHWSKFASDEANILLRVKRQFDTNIKTIRCSNYVWHIESENGKSETDQSEWIKVGEASFFLQNTSPQELSMALQKLLDNLNVQPGSDIRPDKKLTSLE